MSSRSRILFLTSLLVLALSAVLVGCAQKTPALDEIIDNTVAAMSKIDTYKYDLDMKTDYYRYDVTKNETVGENATAKDVTKMVGIINVLKKEMHTTIDYSGSVQGQLTSKLPPIEFSMRPLLSLEFFTTGNESFLKFAIPSRSGERWGKTGIDVWEYLDQATQQIELLKSAAEVGLAGTEEVNGIDCYILKANPDGEKLAGWLSRQLTLISLGNTKAVKDDSLSSSMKLWITQDSYLLSKTELELKLQEGDGRSIIKGQIDFYDYNQPVSIIIPQEALEATETGTPK